ncbi:hypothetical protein [Streptomyces violaceusniger]|uniref:Uncharacterized protein n=1 Tax=Streptomyces violaceusniger TaxID=68280 RepID=A0A4D4LQH2_STRVO|nr:hypothetical protein SVIO_107320 [Streptomyces violaceusniger]
MDKICHCFGLRQSNHVTAVTSPHCFSSSRRLSAYSFHACDIPASAFAAINAPASSLRVRS